MIFDLLLILLFVRPIIRLLTRPIFGFGYRRPPMGPPPMMGPHFYHGPHMHHHPGCRRF